MSTAFCKLFSEFLLHISESATTGDRTSNTIAAVRRNEERGEQPELDNGSCVRSLGLLLPSSLCGSQGHSPPWESTHWTSPAPPPHTFVWFSQDCVSWRFYIHWQWEVSNVDSPSIYQTDLLLGVADVTVSQAEPSPQTALPWKGDASLRQCDVNLGVDGWFH